MELSRQVVTLEQAKKLAELGVKVKTLFVWSKLNTIQPAELKQYDLQQEMRIASGDKVYPAPTVAELGEMLRKVTGILNHRRFAEYYPGELLGAGIIRFNRNIIGKNINFSISFADAIIWLLEQKLLTAQQINEAA